MFIGCPHCSLDQLKDWAHRIPEAPAREGRTRSAVLIYYLDSTRCPMAFDGTPEKRKLWQTVPRFTYIWPTSCTWTTLPRTSPVVTCSEQAGCTYTSARYFDEDDLLRIIARGRID